MRVFGKVKQESDTRAYVVKGNSRLLSKRKSMWMFFIYLLKVFSLSMEWEIELCMQGVSAQTPRVDSLAMLDENLYLKMQLILKGITDTLA